ncbi:MAG TPA: hypothetical protein VLT88_12140 [Desulfosarcina sp.]|nr:hypothetical protein [Desulfosarcina sp.]
MRNKLTLQWSGTFIELCMGRITPDQRRVISDRCLNAQTDIRSSWYLNTKLLERHFGTSNWWALDDLDHVMGLVFEDRADLAARLASIAYGIDGMPVTVDPEMIQLSVYAPEPIDKDGAEASTLCHGARRQAELALTVDVEPPFDPSLITLSLLDYPDVGLILIDLDYDGHDDIQFAFGESTYLQPRFL